MTIGIPLSTVKDVLADVIQIRKDIGKEYEQFGAYKSKIQSRTRQVRNEVQELAKKCARLEKENKALQRENEQFRYVFSIT